MGGDLVTSQSWTCFPFSNRIQRGIHWDENVGTMKWVRSCNTKVEDQCKNICCCCWWCWWWWWWLRLLLLSYIIIIIIVALILMHRGTTDLRVERVLFFLKQLPGRCHVITWFQLHFFWWEIRGSLSWVLPFYQEVTGFPFLKVETYGN